MTDLGNHVIKTMLEQRSAFLKSKNMRSADKIQNEITSAFIKQFNGYEVDFILETLSKFGDAPQLLYDDNGRWAVSGDGYAPAVAGTQKIEGSMTAYVKKAQWKNNIRAALKHYLTK